MMHMCFAVVAGDADSSHMAMTHLLCSACRCSWQRSPVPTGGALQYYQSKGTNANNPSLRPHTHTHTNTPPPFPPLPTNARYSLLIRLHAKRRGAAQNCPALPPPTTLAAAVRPSRSRQRLLCLSTPLPSRGVLPIHVAAYREPHRRLHLAHWWTETPYRLQQPISTAVHIVSRPRIRSSATTHTTVPVPPVLS